MAVRRLSEEGGLNPQLRYVKRGKLCVVEMPHRLRLDPATVIKTVVKKEKPEVVNITAMAWLGESDSPLSDEVDESPPLAPKEKEVLVSITLTLVDAYSSLIYVHILSALTFIADPWRDSFCDSIR